METKRSAGLAMEPASSAALAWAITRRASAQTYHTVRWLVDRDLTDDAFRAYAYFRWVDDTLDAPSQDRAAQRRFLARQEHLLGALQAGDSPNDLAPQEQLLSDLLARRDDGHPGFHSYLEKMMAVMEFDAGRRGRLVTAPDLERYTGLLAEAVMDVITYFIGHDHVYPNGPARTEAVRAAHIIHMLRDTVDDVQAGYYNIPRQLLEANHLSPSDITHPVYRDWVRERLDEARRSLAAGRRYIRSMGNLRAQLACSLYCLRFEIVLHRIELDGYLLRPHYTALAGTSAWIQSMVRSRPWTDRTPSGDAG